MPWYFSCKSHWFCGLVQIHPQDVVVFILNTATESGWLSPWDPPLQWGKVRKRIYRPATHPIHFAAVSPDKIIAALRGRYFSFRELHLENFMSRPNVIPTFRQRRCTNRGRNFVRSKRWLLYMSSTTSTYFCVLTIRKHLLNLSGRGPSICYRRPFCRLKAPLGLSLLRKRGLFRAPFSRVKNAT